MHFVLCQVAVLLYRCMKIFNFPTCLLPEYDSLTNTSVTLLCASYTKIAGGLGTPLRNLDGVIDSAPSDPIVNWPAANFPPLAPSFQHYVLMHIYFMVLAGLFSMIYQHP